MLTLGIAKEINNSFCTEKSVPLILLASVVIIGKGKNSSENIKLVFSTILILILEKKTLCQIFQKNYHKDYYVPK